MQIRCIHEVYFQPKMFETIGFHHQGSYNISAQVYHLNPTTKQKSHAYPILSTQKSQIDYEQQSELDKILDRTSYQTKKFDVSFNEQEFLFHSGCRFKIQFDVPATSEGNKCLYLGLELIKYNVVETKEDLKGMISTENIIKNSLDNHKDSSSQKIAGVSQQNSLKNIPPNNKIWEKVCEVVMLIDTSDQNVSTASSIYQAIVFPNQQFFGKLFFMINHVKIGYKVRASSFTLSNFINLHRTLSSSVKLPSKAFNPSAKQLNKLQLIAKLRQSFENVCACYNQMILKQIKQFHAIEEIQRELFNEPQYEYSLISRFQARTSNSSNRITKNSANPNKFQQTRLSSTQYTPLYVVNKKQLISIQISEPPQEISTCTQNLLGYYQCEDLDELYFIIYQESVNLNQSIMLKWINVVFLMNRQKWCSNYFHKTIRNFKDQNQYLMENKVLYQLQPRVVEKNFEPKLKYRFYIHDFLPDLYIKKERTAIKPFIGMTSEHILFVLVHGFNGNEFDMNRIKSFISYFCSPHFLVLRNISVRIMEDLDTIGKAAAEEISQFVKLRPFIKRINFIGFSLGGVIIRACLSYLKEYHKLFNLLITLSSPHLGLKEVKDCIVKTGMKVLHKFRGAKNIKQLLLDINSEASERAQRMVKDERNQQEGNLCYLQKLSKDSCLSAFNLVLMCGSQEDKYVPGFSATLDYRGESQRMLRMQKNLKKNIKNLHQIFVKFNQKKNGTIWDRITGRRIHINFLDDDSFLYFLLGQYFHIF